MRGADALRGLITDTPASAHLAEFAFAPRPETAVLPDRGGMPKTSGWPRPVAGGAGALRFQSEPDAVTPLLFLEVKTPHPEGAVALPRGAAVATGRDPIPVRGGADSHGAEAQCILESLAQSVFNVLKGTQQRIV